MAWLPDGEKISKISLFVFVQLTNVTDRQTPGDGIYLAYAQYRAVTNFSIFVLALFTLRLLSEPAVQLTYCIVAVSVCLSSLQ